MQPAPLVGRAAPRAEGSRLIVGLDPGSALLGFGVIRQAGGSLTAVDYGAISTPKGVAAAQRLELLYTQLRELLDRVHPDSAAVESLFFNVNVRTALAVGQARGVALLACAQAGCRVCEYTPQQVKQGVVGYGRAEKGQVQEMVRLLLRLDERPRPDDAADALAVAICHANADGLQRAVTRAMGKT